MRDLVGSIGRGLAAATVATTVALPAAAIDIDDVGGETLTVDVSNTTELSYHFDNRNDTPVDATNQTLTPSEWIDDEYAEWQNRLYLRAFYWRLSFGLRLDSAVYIDTMSRADAQELIRSELGRPDLALENRFGRELHSRYSHVVYPAKLWLSYSEPGLEATVGDFYAQLGRGLVFSVRKIDEIGVDTTVRGVKVSADHSVGDFRIAGMAFGGQMNPMRIDLPTGRILTGSGSPMFFLFPEPSDFEYYSAPTDTETTVDRARPGYLEDTAVGARLEAGTSDVQLGLNGAILRRQSGSADQLRCRDFEGRPPDECLAEFPSFSTPEASRAHDQINNVSASVTVPPIADVIDGYVEVAGQHQSAGRVISVDAAGNPAAREEDLSGYAVYANVNVTAGPVTTTLEGKHYRSFYPLGANIDTASPGFGAPEFNIVTYSQPPNAESVYTEPIGAPDVCNTGGRAKVDVRFDREAMVFGWLGRYSSFSEIDPTNRECATDDDLRTDTWDTAGGLKLDAERGKTHAWAWVGARFADRAEPAINNALLPFESAVFYREEYVRYDLNKHLVGDFSVSSLGFHRRRYEPTILVEPWHEGENYLALSWAPHLAFVFGYEYQTRPGFPTHYFSGAIEYRSKSDETVWHQIANTARLFVGQRRAAQRCVGGTCRIFPAFEGAKLEL
ncbi:MAG: hypothetical protein JRI23_05985, partial [Deltaproteobacteria bacterium]|nr:hypothetical protein [Deltaproteobacteria bacterium]